MKKILLSLVCAAILALTATSCVKECKCVTTNVYTEFPEYNETMESTNYAKKCEELNDLIIFPNDAGTSTTTCQ